MTTVTFKGRKSRSYVIETGNRQPQGNPLKKKHGSLHKNAGARVRASMREEASLNGYVGPMQMDPKQVETLAAEQATHGAEKAKSERLRTIQKTQRKDERVVSAEDRVKRLVRLAHEHGPEWLCTERDIHVRKAHDLDEALKQYFNETGQVCETENRDERDKE